MTNIVQLHAHPPRLNSSTPQEVVKMTRLQTELTVATVIMLGVNTCCQAAMSYVLPVILTLMVIASDNRLRRLTISGYQKLKRKWETPTERQQIEEMKNRLSRLSTLCATSFTLLDTRVRNLGRKVDDRTTPAPPPARPQEQATGRQRQAGNSSDEEAAFTPPQRFLCVPNTEGPARNTRSRRPKVTMKLTKTSDGNYRADMNNNASQAPSFYFSCKLCLVELWLASPSRADLCIACRPRLHKRDQNFVRIVDTEAEKLWYCCCPSCLSENTRNCRSNPCISCTQWRGFVEPQEPENEL